MNEPFDITVSEVVENEDGSATLSLQLSDEFKSWFKEEQGLKRWSHKRFEKWFHKKLSERLELGEAEDLIDENQ